MSAYSVQDESRSILRDLLLKDPKLNLPASYAAAAEKVRFEGPDSQPFIPTPLKITESSSALNGLLATAASAVAHDRYGTPLQDVVVNTDLSTLFLMSLLLPTVSPSGVPALEHPVIKRGLAAGELHDMARPLRRLCTNVYRTRDGRFFHLHGSMNSSPSMEMVGLAPGSVEEQAVRDVDMQGAIDVYSAKVAEWDAEEIDRAANDEYGQAGTVCLTPEEFAASEHGRAMEGEGLYVLNEVKAERKPWPAPAPASAAAGAGEGEDEEKETTTKSPGRRPLEGIRVIDLSRVIAGPVISKMLAVLGADVVKVTARHLPDVSVTWVDLSAGKKDASLDLKASPEDRRAFEDLVRGADVLIDGYRPGVLEGKLGYDRKKLRELNPQLVYLHENCYGWKGPLAKRSGWQQISDCVTGISWMQGRFLGLDEPVVPLLPNSDYQMGLVGASAVIHALLRRAHEDLTFDIDVSLTQYNMWYSRDVGAYSTEQQQALRDRNSGFAARHYDDILVLVTKTMAAMRAARGPELFANPAFWEDMSGEEWGLSGDEKIRVLACPFRMSESEVGYRRPSGTKGRSKPVWD